MKDRYGREIEYMRISVTDRCNLRCRYCMPAEGIVKVDRSLILQCDEIIRICRAATELGITKFKITGGEPLLRGDILKMIRGIKVLPGTEQVTLTTNGQALSDHIDGLAEAGIDGINISLDTLRPDRYEDITRGGSLDKVLEAVDLSVRKGIRTKLNCLVQKGFNEDEVTDLAEYALGKGIDLRFIELMPVGIADAGRCINNIEILERLKESYPDIQEDISVHGNGPAVYYKVPGRSGGIGFISAIHSGFCERCNRVRLTSMGYLKPCLCYEEGTFIRPYLDGSDEELKAALAEAIEQKPQRHCFGNLSRVDHHSMAQIGG